MDIRKSTGRRGEYAAASFLRSRGVAILKNNFRSRFGEIDLLARDGKYLIAVEVKTRRYEAAGHPAESVDFRKQVRICRTFNYYRMVYKIPEDMPVRMDVVEVIPQDGGYLCHWIKNAFEFVE